MIKAALLDIDGVLIGGRPGFNFPLPNIKVIKCLQKVSKKIKIFLCTARPSFAISDLIERADLEPLHITCGGAEIKNYSTNKFIKKILINPVMAKKFVIECDKKGLYLEVYASDKYAIEKNSYCEMTKINEKIIEKKPIFVSSLESFIEENEIVKIMPAAFDKNQKKLIEKIVLDFPGLQLQFAPNQFYAPKIYAVITAKGVDKASAAKEISHYCNIRFDNILGVGDGYSDWDFIKLCKYKSTLENGNKELKKLVISEARQFSYVSPSVEENGILDIFKYFKLI